MADRMVTVRYQVATYSGTVDVWCDENADYNEIIAKAKALLRQRSGGTLPFGYQHFEIEKTRR